MGFPTFYYCAILPWPLLVIMQLLDLVKLTFFSFLYRPPVLPSPPIPNLGTSPSSAKRRLPVLPFSAFLYRDRDAICAICLCPLEPRHLVRLLGNCSHAFHRPCMDKWLDQGHLTCPLCRSGSFTEAHRQLPM